MGRLQSRQGRRDLWVSTPGGRFQVRWDENGRASALGQRAFFAEFLEVSGLFERWVESCLMAYTSPNAPEVGECAGHLAALDSGWSAPLRLARFFGGDAQFWMNLQARYDLEVAEHNLRKRIDREVTPMPAAA